MLFNILPHLGIISRGLEGCFLSDHALAVSAEVWQLFYILSRLSSIRRGLVCYASTVSACYKGTEKSQSHEVLVNKIASSFVTMPLSL